MIFSQTYSLPNHRALADHRFAVFDAEVITGDEVKGAHHVGDLVVVHLNLYLQNVAGGYAGDIVVGDNGISRSVGTRGQ